MKLFNFRTNILLFLTFLYFGFFVVWYFSAPTLSQVFFVKIPPKFDKTLNNEHTYNMWLAYGFDVVPISEIRNRKLWSKAYVPMFIISIEQNGKIVFTDDYEKHNLGYVGKEMGNLENVAPLEQFLKSCFDAREQNGVFEEITNKVKKRVTIKAPRSAKYGEVAKLIDVVKSSGADPIVLQIDDLPE